LDEYDNNNKQQWAGASRMRETQGNYDKHLVGATAIDLYNAGDIESHF
jgi:hypothetical protein